MTTALQADVADGLGIAQAPAGAEVIAGKGKVQRLEAVVLRLVRMLALIDMQSWQAGDDE